MSFIYIDLSMNECSQVSAGYKQNKANVTVTNVTMSFLWTSCGSSTFSQIIRLLIPKYFKYGCFLAIY